MTPNSLITTVCILCLWTGPTQAQASSEIEIFPTESPNSEPKDSEKSESCGLNKECVPHYLCDKKGNVIRSGEFLIDGRNYIIDIRAQGECSYLEVCCNIGNKMTKPEPIPAGPEGCGYRNPDGVGFSITGYKEGESQFGEFPWMVAILSDEVIGGETLKIYICGGAVIAPNVVLTAAHRLKDVEPQNLIARAGEWDTRTKNEALPHQDARVKEIIRHEQFDKGTFYNDVALLILETSYSWAENVRPICLPAPNANFDYSRCYATGWGKDKYNDDDLKQVILKKRELPTVTHGTCEAELRRTRLSKYFDLDPSFMCAGGEPGNDMCIGDGGSPLVCPDPQNPNRYYQAGIVSWGISCGESNIPGVYASVPYMRKWINEKLSARGIDFSHFTM